MTCIIRRDSQDSLMNNGREVPLNDPKEPARQRVPPAGLMGRKQPLPVKFSVAGTPQCKQPMGNV
jgi:hypothetical protein